MSQEHPRSQSEWEDPPEDCIGYDCALCQSCISGGGDSCAVDSCDLHAVDDGPDGIEIRCRHYWEDVV